MYRQRDHRAGADQQFPLSGTSGNTPFAQTPFASPIYTIDPALNDGQHLHPAKQPNVRQPVHVGPASSELSAASMNPPGDVSPRSRSNISDLRTLGFKPTDRSLPSRDVSADTITSTFADFILYCNPKFALDVDTAALRAAFQTPPKSDNKDYDIFRLFELIRRFDAKEIKTWGKLALDLGVEAPDTSKGQSGQKVQQYTVRLKRWMRAMHIDAFFEYLLGKQHSYFTNIPHPDHPHPSAGRDGVTAEEDLAIRALDPSFRPKRGRRRNSETEKEDGNESDFANKQPRLLDSVPPFSGAPISAVPLSSHADNFTDPWATASAVTPQTFAPWSGKPSGPASAISANPNLRWQLGRSQTPNSPHPLSAISPSMSQHIDTAFDSEPRSAVTPSSRRKRRHGPAVSSAWPSNNTPGAKPRGRPPAHRNTQDGPYSKFPADPLDRKSNGQVMTSTESVGDATYPRAVQSPFPTQSEGRPGRLSLQVPPHTGAPVRLATPPTLLVNGETNEAGGRSDPDDPGAGTAFASARLTADASTTGTSPSPAAPGFTFEALKRVMTSDLLRADIIGRRQRLTGDEAKRLADAVLDRLGVPRSEHSNPRDELARLTAASWLGVGDQYNVPLGPSAGYGKRIKVTRFRTDPQGYEEITFDEDSDEVRDVFDLAWHVSQGGCMGSFEMKGLSLAPGAAALEHERSTESTHDMILRKALEVSHDLRKDGLLEQAFVDVARSSLAPTKTAAGGGGGGGGDDETVDWKAKCKAMEFAAMLARGESQRVHQRLVEKIIDAIL